jgi:lipoprotein-releasing system permease protein
MRLLVFLAVRQLWARKGLNGVAMGGVALGVFALVVMRAIMIGFQQEFKDNVLRAADHVVLHDRRLLPEKSILEQRYAGPVLANVSHDLMISRERGISRPADTAEMLESLPGVAAVCPQLTGQGVLSFETRTIGVNLRGIVANDQEQCTPIAGYLQSGSWPEFEASRDGILLGSLVADKLGVRVGDRVRLVAPEGAPRSLRVLGVFEVHVNWIDRSWAFVPLSTAQSVLATTRVSELGVRLDDPSRARMLAERAEQLTGYDADSWQEVNAAALSVYSLQNTVVACQIAAILAVGGFGILAVQIMIVLQKAKDIAILRSVGICRRDILTVFLLQGVFIAAVGALLGDVLANRAIAIIASFYDPTAGYKGAAQLRVLDDPASYLMGAIFAVALGTVASAFPAWRGSRVEPVDVLRGQVG